MKITYSISLWNFYHYSRQPSLERVIQTVRQAGYGIEIWGAWGDELNLYDAVGRKRLATMTEGMTVSLHSNVAQKREQMLEHIDTAAAIGGRVIVLHPDDLAIADDRKKPNLDYARWAVEYADRRGVRLALENGELGFLCETIEAVDGLGFCLDTGHPYPGGSIADFLNALKHRLIHLHLQDILPQAEKNVPDAFGDHYILGTGGIPAADWQNLSHTLKEINFDGIGVFEIHPRNPLQTAFLGRGFIEGLVSSARQQQA